MKYLTPAGKRLLMKQIKNVEREIKIIELTVPPGNGVWTKEVRYKQGLEFLLDMEENE